MGEHERAGGLEGTREVKIKCKGGIREYRVWSIEYRERHYLGWRVAASGGGWRKERQRYREDREPEIR